MCVSGVGGCDSACPRGTTDNRSVAAQRARGVGLAHLLAALHADLPGLLHEVVLGAVLVLAGLAALLGRLVAAATAGVGVRDPRRLLLARALLAQTLVLLVVLGARTVILRHVQGLPDRAGIMTR